MPKFFHKSKPSPDFLLLAIVLIITLFGIIMIYNASIIEAYQLFADKYRFLKLQSLWLGLGLLALFTAYLTPYQLIKKIAPTLLGINILLLIAVLIPGIGNQALGARRWINIAGFTLQPTEMIKLTLPLYLSSWLSKEKPFWPYLVILALILILIMLEPDLGTSIVVIFTAVAAFYFSGASMFKMLILGILGSLSGIALIFSSSYRKNRLLTFLNPSTDPLGNSYHIRQALIAIGSGGFWGLGLGQSRQKYQFLPQVTTDSIFAVIAEEIGFFASAIVILFLFFIVFRALNISRYAPDKFTKLLSFSIACWFGIQIFINLGAMLALVPLTGVPLPFISYGGSSLIISLTAVGLLLNISRFKVKR